MDFLGRLCFTSCVSISWFEVTCTHKLYQGDLCIWRTKCLYLQRGLDPDDLGFDLVGGKDDPQVPNDNSIFVSHVSKGSVADGKLKWALAIYFMYDIQIIHWSLSTSLVYFIRGIFCCQFTLMAPLPANLVSVRMWKCILISRYCIQGKFLPRFIFTLFALWPEGEFKTEPVELYIKDNERKLKCGQIQHWANQSQISIRRK